MELFGVDAPAAGLPLRRRGSVSPLRVQDGIAADLEQILGTAKEGLVYVCVQAVKTQAVKTKAIALRSHQLHAAICLMHPLRSDAHYSFYNLPCTHSTSFLWVEDTVQSVGEGSEGAGGGAILHHLHLLRGSKAKVREPITQPPPVMTQDMLAEKEAALSALGDLPPLPLPPCRWFHRRILICLQVWRAGEVCVCVCVG